MNVLIQIVATGLYKKIFMTVITELNRIEANSLPMRHWSVYFLKYYL